MALSGNIESVPDRTSDLLLMLEGAKEACPTFLPTLVLVGELVSTTTTVTTELASLLAIVAQLNKVAITLGRDEPRP